MLWSTATGPHKLVYKSVYNNWEAFLKLSEFQVNWAQTVTDNISESLSFNVVYSDEKSLLV